MRSVTYAPYISDNALQDLDRCVLCWGDLSNGEPVVAHEGEGLNHPIHKACIKEVVHRNLLNPKCPTCQVGINTSSLLSLKERVGRTVGSVVGNIVGRIGGEVKGITGVMQIAHEIHDQGRRPCALNVWFASEKLLEEEHCHEQYEKLSRYLVEQAQILGIPEEIRKKIHVVFVENTICFSASFSSGIIEIPRFVIGLYKTERGSEDTAYNTFLDSLPNNYEEMKAVLSAMEPAAAERIKALAEIYYCQYSDQEIESVLLHELGHVKYQHQGCDNDREKLFTYLGLRQLKESCFNLLSGLGIGVLTRISMIVAGRLLSGNPYIQAGIIAGGLGLILGRSVISRMNDLPAPPRVVAEAIAEAWMSLVGFLDGGNIIVGHSSLIPPVFLLSSLSIPAKSIAERLLALRKSRADERQADAVATSFSEEHRLAMARYWKRYLVWSLTHQVSEPSWHRKLARIILYTHPLHSERLQNTHSQE